MTVEEAVRLRVLALTAVTTLVSTRVYLQKFPQTPTMPAVLVSLVDDPESYHLRGPHGLRRARIQVDAVAKEGSGVDAYRNAAALAAAVDGDGKGTAATGLSGWTGTIGGVRFDGIFRIDRVTRYEPDELRFITMMQDYYVYYKDAA